MSEKMIENVDTSRMKRVRRIALVEMLNEVALATNVMTTKMDILSAALRIVVSKLDLQAGAIFLLDETDHQLKLAIRHGISEEHVQEIERRRANRPGLSAQEQVANTKKGFFIQDMSTDPRFEGMWDELNNRSYVQIPLLAKDHLLGVLGVVSKVSEPIAVREVAVLEAIGNQLGLLVMNAELLNESRRSEIEANQLLELGTRINSSLDQEEVLEAISGSSKELLRAKYGFVALMDEKMRSVTIKTVAGPASRDFIGKKIHFIRPYDDSDQDFRQPILLVRDEIATEKVWNLSEITALGIVTIFAIALIREKQMLGLLGVMCTNVCSFSARDIRLLRQLGESVVISLENAQLYQQVRSVAVLEERGWLAREMHDNLAQGLGLINIQATVIEDLLAEQNIDQAKHNVSVLKEIANRSYTDVREAIFNLRSSVAAKIDFIHALEEYLKDYYRHYGVETILNVDDPVDITFSNEKSVQIIRIIQEAITNARAHGGAEQVKIQIALIDGYTQITVTDKGRGFDLSSVKLDSQRELGLQIMKERAKSIGGDLEIISSREEGTRVVIDVPPGA